MHGNLLIYVAMDRRSTAAVELAGLLPMTGSTFARSHLPNAKDRRKSYPLFRRVAVSVSRVRSWRTDEVFSQVL